MLNLLFIAIILSIIQIEIFSKLCVPVYITVCSAKKYKNLLELNWNDECNEEINWIGLFESDPVSDPFELPLVKINSKEYPNYYLTDIRLNIDVLPNRWSEKTIEKHLRTTGPQCLNYWIASFQNNQSININCLKIQPTWMTDNIEDLRRIPLSDLMIPGTHNSGSFNRTAHNNIWWSGYKKFILTQDQDIWTQLVFGIRYLDLRISYYHPMFSFGSDVHRRFWINHDFVKITRLYPILQDIRYFLDSTENEVIIMDIHRLPIGFNEERRHNKLRNLLYSEFGDIVVDYDEAMSLSTAIKSGPTINDLIKMNKKLIICYSRNEKEFSWLWPPLSHNWGNKQDLPELINFISTILDQQSEKQLLTNPGENPFWAVMATLTPTQKDILNRNIERSFRSLSDSISKNITEYTEKNWWKKCNIIATDFFLSNNLIELSIKSIVHKKTTTP